MNEKEQYLKQEIISALEITPLVAYNLTDYAEFENVSVRTVQRLFKAIANEPEFDYVSRRDGFGYFVKKGHNFRELTSKKYTLIRASEVPHNGSVSFVSFVSPLLLLDRSLSKELEDKKRTSDTRDTRDIDDMPKDIPIASNGDSHVEPGTYFGGDFAELRSMVLVVCKKDPMLVLDDDEKLIERLFKAGVTSNEIFRNYHRSKTPNYWFSSHWKGKKFAPPTLKDIFDTIVEARQYRPQPWHSWPNYRVICKEIQEVMIEVGRKKERTAMEKYKELGYDEIIRRIPGGYINMANNMSTTLLNIKIAEAIRDIKTEEEHSWE